MSLRRIKTQVTKFFKDRKATLRGIGGGVVAERDDYLELFVLYELLVRCATPIARNLRTIGTRSHFVVALSPSRFWSRASFFECVASVGKRSTFGLRTGLSVTSTNGPSRAELDVVIVELAPVQGDDVMASQVAAAIECKWHGDAVGAAVSDGVIGKAFRLWGLPLAPIPASAAARLALASHSRDQGAIKNDLSHCGIMFLSLSEPGDLLGAHSQGVVRALGL